MPAGAAKNHYHGESGEDESPLAIVYDADRLLRSEDAACYIAEMAASLHSLAAGAHLQLLASLLRVAHEEARLNCADPACRCHQPR